jgi:hypothetical protein
MRPPHLSRLSASMLDVRSRICAKGLSFQTPDVLTCARAKGDPLCYPNHDELFQLWIDTWTRFVFSSKLAAYNDITLKNASFERSAATSASASGDNLSCCVKNQRLTKISQSSEDPARRYSVSLRGKSW